MKSLRTRARAVHDHIKQNRVAYGVAAVGTLYILSQRMTEEEVAELDEQRARIEKLKANTVDLVEPKQLPFAVNVGTKDRPDVVLGLTSSDLDYATFGPIVVPSEVGDFHIELKYHKED